MVTSSPLRTFDCNKSPSVGMSTMTQIQEAISRLPAMKNRRWQRGSNRRRSRCFPRAKKQRCSPGSTRPPLNWNPVKASPRTRLRENPWMGWKIIFAPQSRRTTDSASPGKTGRSSRDSIYCLANCRALSQQWKLSTICDSTHVRLFVCHYIA